MVKIKLVPYRLKIKDLDSSKKNHPVYLDLETCNLRGYFQEFIKDHQVIQINTAEGKIFSCHSCYNMSEDDIYYGLLGSGDFGYSTELINVDTKNNSGNRGTKDAERIKFYYMLKIFSDEAYLLLNQFKKNGMKTDLQLYLKKYLIGKMNKNIEVIINPLVSSGLLKMQEAQKIRFIKKRYSRDIEGQILGKEDKEDREEIVEEKSLIIGGNKKISIINILKKLLGNYQEKKYVEIDDSKFEEVKVDAEMDDGSHKVLTLTGGFSYHEGIEQEFSGDFPTEKKFYTTAKPYFVNVIKESKS